MIANGVIAQNYIHVVGSLWKFLGGILLVLFFSSLLLVFHRIFAILMRLFPRHIFMYLLLALHIVFGSIIPGNA